MSFVDDRESIAPKIDLETVRDRLAQRSTLHHRSESIGPSTFHQDDSGSDVLELQLTRIGAQQERAAYRGHRQRRMNRIVIDSDDD